MTEKINNISQIIRSTEEYSDVCDMCRDEILLYPTISGRTEYTQDEVEQITLKRIIDKLRAKEQECEELHARTASIIYSLTGGRLSYSTYTLEACEQAYHDQLEIDVERATKELQEENETLKQEASKFKQALDEIEEIVRYNNFLVRDPFCGSGYRDLSGQILNIIKNTKEEI